MRTAANILMGIVTLGMLALTVLTILAGYAMSPFFSLFGVFVVFFPILVLADVLLLVHWIFNLKFIAAIAVGLVLAASLPSLFRVISLNPQLETRETENSLKLLTWNVKLFEFDAERCKKATDYLNACNPDIICMQEFGFYIGKSPTLADIRQQLKKYPYMHISSGKGWNKGIQKHVVTFSKFPIAGKREIDLDSRYHKAIISDIVIANGDTLKLVNCYLESNKLSADEKQLDGDGQIKSIFNKLATASLKRVNQAGKIAEEVGDKPARTIVCGDMNDVPNSKTYGIIRGNMHDSFTMLKKGMGITFHESIYNFRIDYIFASKDVNLLNFCIDKQKLSDHYPIMVGFEL